MTWKNAYHRVVIQFDNYRTQMVSKNKIRNKNNFLAQGKNTYHTIPFIGKNSYHTIPFFGKNGYHTFPYYEKNVYHTIPFNSIE